MQIIGESKVFYGLGRMNALYDFLSKFLLYCINMECFIELLQMVCVYLGVLFVLMTS